MKPVRWGILGTGNMAATLASEMNAMSGDDIELVAVASRRLETATAFAQAHDMQQAYGSYEELAADPNVDAVYIATPHTLHFANMQACIRGGKAVLCEKPFTINVAQARELIEEARRRQVFVMEAMWTRFLPAVVALRDLISQSAIGTLQIVMGGGGFIPDRSDAGYLLNKDLGGGVLLDAGVYLVSMASMLLGPPQRVLASGDIGASGVDEHDTVILEHRSGARASLYVSLRTRRPPDLEILGDAGRILVGAPIFHPRQLTVWDEQGNCTEHDFPTRGSGYGYQVLEVARCLRADLLESTIMSLDETLSIMQTMDHIRSQIGLVYAADK